MKVGSVDTGHYVGIDRRVHSERTLGELSLSSPSEFVFRPRDLLIATVPLDDVVSNVRVAFLDIEVNHLVVVVTGALPAQLAPSFLSGVSSTVNSRSVVSISSLGQDRDTVTCSPVGNTTVCPC